MLYPGDLLYRRGHRDYEDTKSNAIDDFGTDVPKRQKSEVWVVCPRSESERRSATPSQGQVRILRQSRGFVSLTGAGIWSHTI